MCSHFPRPGLLAKRRARQHKGSVAVPRNEDDVILIDGLSNLLTKRRPKHRGSMPVSRDVEDGTDMDEAELIDAVSGLLATASINRRARHKGSVAVQRNEDDMLLINLR